jgi:hypothetical protein
MSRTRPQTPVDPLDAITQSIQQLAAQVTAQISALDAKFTAILDQQQAAFTQAIQRQDQTIQVGFEAQSATIDVLSAKVDDIDTIIESKLADLQLDDKLAVLDSKFSTHSSTLVSDNTLSTIFSDIFQDDQGSFSPDKLRSFLKQSDDTESSSAFHTLTSIHISQHPYGHVNIPSRTHLFQPSVYASFAHTNRRPASSFPKNAVIHSFHAARCNVNSTTFDPGKQNVRLTTSSTQPWRPG